MKYAVLGLVVLIGLSGCAATTSIQPKDAQYVPRDRIFRLENLSPASNATATFVRDIGFVSGGVYQHLFIDGVKSASLDSGEKVEFIISPGEHIFGVVPTDPFGSSSIKSIDQDLKLGRQYFYRIQTDGNTLQTVLQRFLPQ